MPDLKFVAFRHANAFLKDAAGLAATHPVDIIVHASDDPRGWTIEVVAGKGDTELAARSVARNESEACPPICF